MTVTVQLPERVAHVQGRGLNDGGLSGVRVRCKVCREWSFVNPRLVKESRGVCADCRQGLELRSA